MCLRSPQCVTYSCCCLRPQIILDRLTFQFLMSRSGLQALGPADSVSSFAGHQSDKAHMARAHGPAIFWEHAAGFGPKEIPGLLSVPRSCVANRKTKEVGVRSHPNNFRSLKALWIYCFCLLMVLHSAKRLQMQVSLTRVTSNVCLCSSLSLPSEPPTNRVKLCKGAFWGVKDPVAWRWAGGCLEGAFAQGF